MTRGAPISETVTLHVPFRIVKRGGRKEMQLPEGAEQPRRTDNTLVKALALGGIAPEDSREATGDSCRCLRREPCSMIEHGPQ